MHQILKNGDSVAVTNFANEELNTKETFTVVSRTGSSGLGSRKFAVASDGTVSVGGNIDTLPGTPNISLNASGSGVFGDGIIASDGTHVTYLQRNAYALQIYDGSATQAYIKNNGDYWGVAGSNIYLTDGTTESNPKISLNADGSATFAGKVSASSAGIKKPSAIGTGFQHARTNGSSSFLSVDATFFSGNTDNLTVDNATFYVTNDGNASFAGKVTSASTQSSDAGTTLATKDYVDSQSSAGSGGIIAHGVVNTDGSKAYGSGNWASTWNGNDYIITLSSGVANANIVANGISASETFPMRANRISNTEYEVHFSGNRQLGCSFIIVA